MVIPNTGSSIVQTYHFDANAGKLALKTTTQLPERTGQRHFAFHDQTLYTVNETASSVTRYTYAQATGFEAQQTLSTLPDDFEGKNSCADIHVTPDGRFLYASNRGHNSLAAYAIAGGALTFLET